ncbi:MAG: enoyl-CoA hydratase [Nocardioides sp.]|nr:enoyl-CoA hydratase [Nocardioides sp.]
MGGLVTALVQPSVSTRRLLLDRPDRANALDAATVERLHDELDLAARDEARMVVLEARGRAFCGGLDLSGLDDESDATMLHRLVRIQLLLERVQSSPALTVALVDGAAVGAGADLVLATDVRLATSGASLRFPGSGFGAVLGTARLAAETSPSYATEVALSARRIDAREGAHRGLWQLLDTPAAVEAEIERLTAAAGAAPVGTTAGLRAAATPSRAGDPLADLVRSLATTPGLRDRIRQHRDRGAR